MRGGRQRGILFLLVVVLGGIQRAGLADDLPAPRYATDQINLAEWQAYFAEVKAISDVQCRDIEPMQHVCDSRSQRTIWVFTRTGHPAHPAVSRGIVISQPVTGGSTLGIDRSGHYVGDRVAFSKWMIELVDSDQRQVSEWGKQLRLQ